MNSILNKKTLFSFSLCLIVSVLCLLSEKIIPFGTNTLAVMDADIQYLDFFGYFKDVLEGKANISYSFAKQLGSTPIAVFSYYLSSPLNLLIYFFSKSQLHIFFSLLVVLKLSLSAFFMAIFLSQRVKELSVVLTIALSLSYAFMQYNLVQASNIMWLDGVYLLPLMLLGVYKVTNKNSALMLIITTALTMLFNWYIALINIVFSGFYFIYEYSLTQNKSWKNFTVVALQYVASIFIALLISSILFIPTYLEMQNGRAGVDWWLLKPEFAGNILTIFSGLILGAESRYGYPAIESTSMVLIGILGLITTFLTQKKKNYIYYILLLGFVILTLYWSPFIFLLSLFKQVDSYWYRYSHLVGFTLVMLASIAYRDGVNFQKVLKSCFIFFVITLIIQLISKAGDLQRIYATAFCCLCFLAIYFYREKRFAGIAVLGLCIIEIFSNFHSLAQKQDVKHWYSYTADVEKSVNNFSNENDFFRVSKLQTRRIKLDKLQANYNEGLGFGFNTFSSYTSSPDNRQRNMLHALGYNRMGPNMNIVNTSILPVDALFSVKLILDNTNIASNLMLPKEKEYRHFSIYSNPYYLPIAFNYNVGNIAPKFKTDNPFLNINTIYSYLLNRNIELFIKVKSSVNYENNKMIVELLTPQKNWVNYAYIDTKKSLNGRLLVNGIPITGYSKWLSPRVVLLPSSQNEKSHIMFEAKDIKAKDIKTVEIYSLNLELLKQITDELKLANKVYNTEVASDNIRFEVSENNSGKVFLSVPYDKQWTIKLNGKEIQTEQVFDALTAISVQKEKKNIIEMSYSVAGLKIGAILSAIGILLFMIFIFYMRHSERERGKENS